jgi:hypothetical protein
VDGAGDERLAGARFAGDEHRQLGVHDRSGHGRDVVSGR